MLKDLVLGLFLSSPAFLSLTKLFFMNDNPGMAKPDLLHVGICHLESIQVVHKLNIFLEQSRNYDKQIRQTFQILREWVCQFGLEPRELFHIGVPVLDGKELITYDCCLEFPLPFRDDNSSVSFATLPGGSYAVLTIEKTPAKIGKAIRRFHGDYVFENQLIVDENRPILKIYHETTMEYCIPVIG